MHATWVVFYLHLSLITGSEKGFYEYNKQLQKHKPTTYFLDQFTTSYVG